MHEYLTQKQKVCDTAMVIAVSRGKFQDLTERNYIFLQK